ncbi:MAG TPA: hypothetical protein VFC00_21155 [Micromonosporaceae bacterium]|nr:hypothetical protein [Micromonosporaceae bacterium]
MTQAGPPSSTAGRRPARRSKLARTLPVRPDPARSVQMTAEQRKRAIDAMAALLAAIWADETDAVDEQSTP